MDYDLSTVAFACIYGLGMLFFTIAFLVDCIRLRRHLREYLAVGVVAGAIVIVIDVAATALAGAVGVDFGFEVICCFLGDLLIFARVVGFAVLGMHYSALLRHPSFAILAWLRIERDWTVGSLPSPASQAVPLSAPAASERTTTTLEEPAADAPSEQRDVPPEPWWTISPLHDSGWGPYLVDVTAVLLGMVAYSVVLFLLTRPTLADSLLTASYTIPREVDVRVIAISLVVALAYGFSEEVFFRLGIQRWLSRYLGKRLPPGRLQFWFPIGLSAFLWTLGHAGQLEPEWVKLAQIFPAGLALGWLCERRGVESTMIVHVVFNVVMVLLASSLIT
ncbi:MAG: CPBP family intramembrane metalloprotease [Anaerolineales bacterium]|nr:MAG: CPBP family intramembrane metalloprotease [Anaerolineales bacterium]